MYNRPMRILKFCPYLALGRNGIVQCGIYATWLIGLPRHKIVGHGTGRCWHVGWCGWCRGDDVFCRSFFRHHFRCRDCFENPLGTPPGDVHDRGGGGQGTSNVQKNKIKFSRFLDVHKMHIMWINMLPDCQLGHGPSIPTSKAKSGLDFTILG